MKKLVVCALCAALVVPTLAVSVQADDSKELVLYTWENMFPQEVLEDSKKKQESRSFILILIQMKTCWRNFPWQKAEIMMLS